MLEHFTPKDNVQDDSEFHKQISAQSQATVNTPDDREFTLEEIRNAVESMNNTKAPGEDGITGEIFKQYTPRTFTMITDSRISVDSIRNTRNHNHLIEEIRKMTSLERADWNIEISWVKVHVGIAGNELADRLAKAAACDSVAKIVFNRLPMNTLISKLKHETKLQWQK